MYVLNYSVDKKSKFCGIQIHQICGLILFASVVKCGAMLQIAKSCVKKRYLTNKCEI